MSPASWFDMKAEVVVIGGAATGAGVLRDLALRGIEALLLEKVDLTSGTSGRNHGLLHSGARYAVNAPDSARKCVMENRILKKIASPCIEDTSGFFLSLPQDPPHYPEELLRACKETYYYHVPCHLRALQVGLPASERPSLIPGLRVKELPEGSCGLAGTYGYKREKYTVASEVGEEIFQALRKLKARMVISDCEACRMQIGRPTGVETFHPIQILRQAYGE